MDDGENHAWQLLSEGWTNYPQYVSKYLQLCYHAGASRCKIEVVESGELTNCEIDFLRMTQTTGNRVRRIRPPWSEAMYVSANAVRDLVREFLATTKCTSGESEQTLLLWTESGEALLTEADYYSLDVRASLRDRLRIVRNALVDLKGTLRVYACMRPLNNHELARGLSTCYHVSRDARSLLFESDGSEEFSFDRVFYPGSDDSFSVVREMMPSIYDGYNITMFTYGQVGAGKTYTMYGTKETPGIAQRCMHELMRLKAELPVAFTVSMLQLHGSRITDLLNESLVKIGVRHSPSGEVFVLNLSEVPVEDTESMHAELVRGLENHDLCTLQQASESHLITTIKFTMMDSGREIRSKLTMVDLARDVVDSNVRHTSCRPKKRITYSQYVAGGVMEATNSLAALGDCIRETLVPSERHAYRNHLLTQLLADCIGGRAKMLVLTCAAPTELDYEETMSSMRWARWIRKPKVRQSVRRSRKLTILGIETINFPFRASVCSA